MEDRTADPLEATVHHVFAVPSQTWQYIVADPTSLRCVLIDPVLDSIEVGSTRSADDEILSIVSRNSYKVDLILDTRCTPTTNRSAAWSLRMQLKDVQGYAPRVSNSAGANVVSGMQRLFARKYGSSLQTNLDEDLKDGEVVQVGRMQVRVMKLPGLCAPNGYAYEIGMNIFGAHSVAMLKCNLQKHDIASFVGTMDEDECHSLWQSFQRTLGLPLGYRLYYDHGTPNLVERPNVRFANAEEATSESSGNSKQAKQKSYSTVAQCRSLNGPIAAVAAEFSTIWERGRNDNPPAAVLDQKQQITPGGRTHRSQKQKEDSVPEKKAARARNWFGRS